MNYYDKIKQKIIDNESYSQVKDYSKERHKIITYFEIGKMLEAARGKYGDNIIDEYSEKLVAEVGSKYNRRTLFRMKQFYNIFGNQKVTPLVTQLSWSHCLVLLPVKDIDKINYYIEQAIIRNLSKRQLDNIIKFKEYERLPEKTKNKLINKKQIGAKDLIKNPLIIKDTYRHDEISERILLKLILEDIEGFMKELGNHFCFIGSEYKIKIGNEYNYIDLLLFNYEHDCFVVVELKVAELRKDHIGQIQVYMNYIDSNLRKLNQNQTIGIIVCKQDNKYIIKYCSDEKIITREYRIV